MTESSQVIFQWSDNKLCIFLFCIEQEQFLIRNLYLGVKQWKKIFYRVVDGPSHLDDETRAKLLEIEAAIFHGVVKEKLEKETNAPWTGNIEEQYKGDSSIAEIIFNSFKYYEKNLKGFKTSFFNFN